MKMVQHIEQETSFFFHKANDYSSFTFYTNILFHANNNNNNNNNNKESHLFPFLYIRKNKDGSFFLNSF